MDKKFCGDFVKRRGGKPLWWGEGKEKINRGKRRRAGEDGEKVINCNMLLTYATTRIGKYEERHRIP